MDLWPWVFHIHLILFCFWMHVGRVKNFFMFQLYLRMYEFTRNKIVFKIHTNIDFSNYVINHILQYIVTFLRNTFLETNLNSRKQSVYVDDVSNETSEIWYPYHIWFYPSAFHKPQQIVSEQKFPFYLLEYFDVCRNKLCKVKIFLFHQFSHVSFFDNFSIKDMTSNWCPHLIKPSLIKKTKLTRM